MSSIVEEYWNELFLLIVVVLGICILGLVVYAVDMAADTLNIITYYEYRDRILIIVFMFIILVFATPSTVLRILVSGCYRIVE